MIWEGIFVCDTIVLIVYIIKGMWLRKMIMAEEKDYEQYCKKVFDILERNDQVDDTIRELSLSFSIPVIVTDPCGVVLMDAGTERFCEITKVMGADDQFWTGIVEEAYADAEEHDLCRENRVWKKNVGKGLLVAEPLYVKGIMGGFCITYHEKRRNACSINQLITQAISIGMGWNREVYGYRDLGVKQMISSLLLSKHADPEQTTKIQKEVFTKYVVCPYVLAVLQTDQDSMKYNHQLHRELCSHYDGVLVCVEKEETTILFTRCDSSEKEKKILFLIEKFAKEYGEIAGISEVFGNPLQIWKKRKILERVMKIGKQMEKDRCIFTEYECYVELICSYAYEKIGADGYGYQKLDCLVEEDREKGTEFYKSLKEYLLAGNSVNLAAKRLFIHRNTMVYRLAKIHEIIQLDINHPDVSRRLLLTMILREFQSSLKE